MRWVAVALGAWVVGAAVGETGTNVFESKTLLSPGHRIDSIVFAWLSSLGHRPALCSDAVFVRRVYLDVLGTLPTAREAREFIQDADVQHKRARLIDRLLQREEYADYWAMKWGDVLRIKAEFPVNLWPNAAQAYHRWVRTAIAENRPYDGFVRDLLTASGSNFRVGAVNFYRALQNRTPEGIADAVALTFLGARAEAWPTNRRADLAVFFSQVGYKPTGEWKEEHVFWDPLGSSTLAGSSAPGRPTPTPIEPGTNDLALAFAPAPGRTNALPPEATFPDGTRSARPVNRDPRAVFADWLIRPKNPWFTRCIANRVWAWLLGRGIVHEPDDLRDDNPPSAPALLACLEKETVAGHYDLKHLQRFILNSQTYQLAPSSLAGEPLAETDPAVYSLRRLDAEVLIDALNQITGSSDLYTSPIPEPFTYIPANQPAVAIADGSITSPFLALFGRSARATGMASERNNKPVPAQWLHLLNSSHIQRKLEQGPRLKALLDSARPPSETADELFLTVLSRFPTPEELECLRAYSPTLPSRSGSTRRTSASPQPSDSTWGPKRREDWVDIAWALINSTEFLYRH